jgi:hypothetical protein
MSEQPPTVTATVEALEAATNGRWGIWLSDTGWWWAARTQTLAAAELPGRVTGACAPPARGTRSRARLNAACICSAASAAAAACRAACR